MSEHKGNDKKHSNINYWNLDLIKLKPGLVGSGSLHRSDARGHEGTKGLTALDFDPVGRLWVLTDRRNVLLSGRTSQSFVKKDHGQGDIHLADIAIDNTKGRLIGLDVQGNRILSWRIGRITEEEHLLEKCLAWDISAFKIEDNSRLAIWWDVSLGSVAYITTPGKSGIWALPLKEGASPNEVCLQGSSGKIAQLIGPISAICIDQWFGSLLVFQTNHRQLVELPIDRAHTSVCESLVKWNNPPGHEPTWGTVNDLALFRTTDYVDTKYLLRNSYSEKGPRTLLVSDASRGRIDKLVQGSGHRAETIWRPLIGDGCAPARESSMPRHPSAGDNLLDESIGTPMRLAVSHFDGRLAFLTEGSPYVKVLTPATMRLTEETFSDSPRRYVT